MNRKTPIPAGVLRACLQTRLPIHSTAGASGIYIGECGKTGAAYIGRAVDMLNRWRVHIHDAKGGSRFRVHRAIRRGEFSFRVLCAAPRFALDALEITAIEWLRPSLNSAPGGIGGTGQQAGFKMPRDVVERVAAKNRGKVRDEFARANYRAGCRLRGEAWREKLRRAATGRVMTDETRAAMRLGQLRRRQIERGTLFP